MPDEPAYIVDIEALKSAEGIPAPPLRPRKAWLGVRFDCCDVYNRVYKNAAGTAYIGRCPKCRRRITVRVGRHGTNERFFRAM